MPNRHGLSIRAADSADAEGLAALMTQAGVAVTREQLAGRLEALHGGAGVVLLADEWGPPTGVIVAHWHAVLDAEMKAGWISTLLVDPSRRRNGVARVLLKAASQAARSAGCGELMLPVGPDAADLQAFCLATGFAPAGGVFTRPLRKRS